MRRTTALLGSAVFFVLVPCVLAGLVPWWINGWRFQAAPFGVEALRVPGALLILLGIPGLVDSFARFAIQGLGTPAPIAPTRTLVVTGLYRHVRNPMYVAVLLVIVGQAVLFADGRLIVYGALFWAACHAFVIAYEEPTLARKFGAQYEAYRTHVPRWMPRFTGWRLG